MSSHNRVAELLVGSLTVASVATTSWVTVYVDRIDIIIRIAASIASVFAAVCSGLYYYKRLRDEQRHD